MPMSDYPNLEYPADWEWMEERAAILEYDALMSRPRAEANAYLLMVQMIDKRNELRRTSGQNRMERNRYHDKRRIP